MVTPRITNKLRGSLGELFYKEYCDQKGWAYTSLENLYSSKNSQWIFTFKKGFHRIQIKIPKEIHAEISWLVKPTNNSIHSPSFVFDFFPTCFMTWTFTIIFAKYFSTICASQLHAV